MGNALWQQDGAVRTNQTVADYLVGNDYVLDEQMLSYDIKATKAHVGMLGHIGLLSSVELDQLTTALSELAAKFEAGEFTVGAEFEDGHSAIEAYLTQTCGDTGKKVHTGRSRNDQSLVMVRLYMLDQLDQIVEQVETVVQAFRSAASKYASVPMPGYTHMQKAMPTTVGVWLGSFADALQDSLLVLEATSKIADQNPLGSAAGFGQKLEIDREFTTQALGFAKTQANPMYCGMSRGLLEMQVLQAMQPTMLIAGKFARDMLRYTASEFDFFSLPDAFVTGSSIMPQKKNYDLFELMRGNAGVFTSNVTALASIAGSIGSGYQRDLQLTKPLLMQGCQLAQATLAVLAEAVPELVSNEAKLAAAITPAMHTADEANQMAANGVPFRDAYKKVKDGIE